MEKDLRLRYVEEAPDSIEGWEKYSLPIGNGRFGASIFGGIKKERIQITTNEFANVFRQGGVSNFLEIHLFLDNDERSDYERGLRLNDGVIYSSFKQEGNLIKREAFFSYPDKVLVYTIKSENPLSLKAQLVIPYLGDRSVEEGGRTGEISLTKDTIIAKGKLPSRDLSYEGMLFARSNGQIKENEDSLNIDNATEITFIFTASTSYKLCKETFFTHKAEGPSPHEEVLSILSKAKEKSDEELFKNHKNNYQSLMNRVDFALSDKEDKRPIPLLLEEYRNNKEVPYLEEVYFFYGRHLLISSSREGGLPASLQGVWTVHDKSPWGSGFWHNINIQMNYWPAFTTNLMETFTPYIDFFLAYLPKAEENALNWVKAVLNEDKKDAGWIIGTGAFAYEIDTLKPFSHSGPGTGGMTAQLFTDAYDFSLDEKLLKGPIFKAVHGMAKFLTGSVKKYDDQYLCYQSASPEQILSGHYEKTEPIQQYYQTIGCAFDEQWLEENAKNDLRFSSILGIEDEITNKEKEQVGKYNAVEIGYSGQIKEYSEEHFYGEIGEYHHRHLSQLVSLMPGDLITEDTPAWLDAAKITLDLRGDFSTGWALAHRICSYARAKEGEHAYSLLRTLLSKKTHPNLWDVHPPFQIDGNFGATAGIAEMLLASHEGYISILPALPYKEWKNIKVKGLRARGNFEVSFKYQNSLLKELIIKPNSGRPLKVKYLGIDRDILVFENDKPVDFHYENHLVSLETKKNHIYRFTNFKEVTPKELINDFMASYSPEGVKLSWREKEEVVLYRAINSDATYQEIAHLNNVNSFIDPTFSSKHKGRATYKIVKAKGGYSASDNGTLCVIHPASELEVERYKYHLKVNNLIGEKIGWDF